MRWRVLVVDDNEIVARQTAELLQDESGLIFQDQVEAEYETRFENALTLLEQRRYDVVVLDVRDQQLAEERVDLDPRDDSERTPADLGIGVFGDVRSRRFVPIIFFTALPALYRHRLRFYTARFDRR